MYFSYRWEKATSDENKLRFAAKKRAFEEAEAAEEAKTVKTAKTTNDTDTDGIRVKAEHI